MSRDLFDSAGDEALAAVGEQMVVAAELLLLVVVWWWCVQPRSTFTPPPPLHNWLCCLCNPGQLACHGSPQKRENIFHSSSSKKRNHVPPRALPVASPLGLSVTLSGRSPLSGRRALRLSHTLRRPARALQRLLLLRRHWPAPSAGLGQRDEPSRHSGRTIENRGQQTRPGLPTPLHLSGRPLLLLRTP